MRTHLHHGVLALVVLGALGAGCSTAAGFGFGEEQSLGGGDGGTNAANNNNGGNGDNGGGEFGSSGGSSGSDAASAADGQVDITPSCDTGLAIDDTNASSFAKALGICTTASANGYGLVSATYSRAFGSTELPAQGQSGLVPQFGNMMVPREGVRLGVLSSGYARNYDTPDGMSDGQAGDFAASGGGPRDGMNYPTGQAPPGFPKAAQGCPQDNLVNDMIDVKLVLVAPKDATGFKFDFDFYSSEWPNYVCSNYNDAFVAYLTSSALTDNISFDANHNPVAVNIDFFNRCTPNTPVGCLRSNGQDSDPPLSIATCSGGVSELAGTGFGDTYQTQCSSGNVMATLGGSTGWLETQAAIKPGEQFTLEFMIWDAGDGLLDSSVLLDNFQWIGGSVSTGTTRLQ